MKIEKQRKNFGETTIPYWGWVIFAGVLAISVWLINTFENRGGC